MTRSKRWLLIYIPVLAAALLLFMYSQNNWIGVTKHTLQSDKLPGGFDSYRIVQLSDLQSKRFGEDQRRLIRKVAALEPDLIVVTGDLTDRRIHDDKAALELMTEAVKLAPVYYVHGNHERDHRDLASLDEKLTEAGVHILRNEHETLPLGDGEIALLGVEDPLFNRVEDGDVDKMESHLRQALDGLDHQWHYTILLSHRPELFEVYARYGIDLSLTGHAHGGQFRIPFVGGVYAPEQGFWPEYYEGYHEAGTSSMLISRGLGNSRFPLRLFNRPEIVLVELRPQ